MQMHASFLRTMLAVGLPLACCQARAGSDVVYADSFEVCAPISANGTVATWNSVFSFAWPGYNMVQRLDVGSDSYLALQFVAGSAGQFGTVSASSFPGSGGIGQFSISRSPGCFNPTVIESNCLSAQEANPFISWLVGNNSLSCALIPGQTYYVNLRLTGCGQNGAACQRDVVQTAQ